MAKKALPVGPVMVPRGKSDPSRSGGRAALRLDLVGVRQRLSMDTLRSQPTPNRVNSSVHQAASNLVDLAEPSPTQRKAQ